MLGIWDYNFSNNILNQEKFIYFICLAENRYEDFFKQIFIYFNIFSKFFEQFY